MEFELHFLQPVAYVCGLLLLACGVGGWDAADEDAPAMSVVGWCISRAVGGVEGNGFAAEDEGSVDLDAAKAFGRGWGGHERNSMVVRSVYKDREEAGQCPLGRSVGQQNQVAVIRYSVVSMCEGRPTPPGHYKQSLSCSGRKLPLSTFTPQNQACDSST